MCQRATCEYSRRKQPTDGAFLECVIIRNLSVCVCVRPRAWKFYNVSGVEKEELNVL